MLNQVGDGVGVQQSEWVWSNAIVVRGEDGLILVDPGIDGSDLNQLADDLDLLGIPVVAGFSTHPHWDHLLWHPRFGDVPRYATPAGAHAAGEARERAQTMAAESASGIPPELIGARNPAARGDGGPVPGEINPIVCTLRKTKTQLAGGPSYSGAEFEPAIFGVRTRSAAGLRGAQFQAVLQRSSGLRSAGVCGASAPISCSRSAGIAAVGGGAMADGRDANRHPTSVGGAS